MPIRIIGDGFISISGIGTSVVGTIAGKLIVTGRVELSADTYVGGILVLDALDSKVNRLSPIFDGNVGIGTSIARVALDIVSTSAILAPAGTNSQRPNGIKGLLRYNTTANLFEGYSGSGEGSWSPIGSSADRLVSIMSCAFSDSWIITTSNPSGNLGLFVTFANDVIDMVASMHRTTPFFYTDNMTPQSTDGWSESGWLVSAATNNAAAYRGIFGDATYWEHTTKTYNNLVPVGIFWQIEFPTPVLVLRLRITGSADTQGNPIGFWLKRSTDGITFTNVQFFGTTLNVTNWWPNDEIRTFFVIVPHSEARFWRIEVTNIGYSNGDARSGPCLRNVEFTTTGFLGIPTLSSAFNLTHNTFKIVMVDTNNMPICTTHTTVDWKFNIMLTKGGQIVNEGLYTITREDGNATIIRSP